MAVVKVIQLEAHCILTDDGKVRYQINRKEGEPGDIALSWVIHDSRSVEAAIRAMTAALHRSCNEIRQPVSPGAVYERNTKSGQ